MRHIHVSIFFSAAGLNTLTGVKNTRFQLTINILLNRWANILGKFVTHS